MIQDFEKVSNLVVNENRTVDLNSESNGSVQHLYYTSFSNEEESQFSNIQFLRISEYLLR